MAYYGGCALDRVSMILQNNWMILQIIEVDEVITRDEESMGEAQRVRASRAELIERISRAVREDGAVEPLEGLRLRRASKHIYIWHGVS